MIGSTFLKFLVIWPDPTYWPTHPPNHPHTHPWVGLSLQIINLQTELNYLDWVNILQFFSDLTWPHPLTHPPNHTPTHRWGSLHKFQIFKWNWNILISSSVIEFLLIPGVPWGWWMDGCGWVGMVVCHVYMHTCMLNMINMDVSMLAAICIFYTCIHVCAFMHMHVHVCGDTPMPLDAPDTPPPTCPPRATGSPKHQNSISLELIKIFRFCLKILYLWTLLNSYRL